MANEWNSSKACPMRVCLRCKAFMAVHGQCTNLGCLSREICGVKRVSLRALAQLQHMTARQYSSFKMLWPAELHEVLVLLQLTSSGPGVPCAACAASRGVHDCLVSQDNLTNSSKLLVLEMRLVRHDMRVCSTTFADVQIPCGH